MKHTVRHGESLHKIAKHHGTTVRRLIQKNPQIRNADLLYPGQKIIIQ